VTFDIPDFAVNPFIPCLQRWKGLLCVAGDFETAGGEPSRNMAIWDGEVWRPFPCRGSVYELGTHDGRLVVGGIFRFNEGFHDLTYVYQQDGSEWLAMGSGAGTDREGSYTTPPITAIASWEGSLYLGGHFVHAGWKPANGIARWDGHEYRNPEAAFMFASAPNPAWSGTAIRWFMNDPGPVRLTVYDIRGRRTASLISTALPGGEQSFEWGLVDDHGRAVPPGVYFLRLETEEGSATRRVVVVR
jgi:hypothetical protein